MKTPTEKVKTIDITPTWSGLLPALVDLTTSESGETRNFAWSELRKMARVADLFNDQARGSK